MSEFLAADQLYKMLHISKRKLKYLLDNGYIPCEVRDSKTWRYRIDKDIAKQIQKQLDVDPDCFRLPAGLFNSNRIKALKNSKSCIDLIHLPAFRSWLTDEYHAYPGALTLAQAAELSCLSSNYLLSKIKGKDIFAVLVGTDYVVSKKSIIDYISSERMLQSKAVNGQFHVLIKKFSLICAMSQ